MSAAIYECTEGIAGCKNDAGPDRCYVLEDGTEGNVCVSCWAEQEHDDAVARALDLRLKLADAEERVAQAAARMADPRAGMGRAQGRGRSARPDRVRPALPVLTFRPLAGHGH